MRAITQSVPPSLNGQTGWYQSAGRRARPEEVVGGATGGGGRGGQALAGCSLSSSPFLCILTASRGAASLPHALLPWCAAAPLAQSNEVIHLRIESSDIEPQMNICLC